MKTIKRTEVMKAANARVLDGKIVWLGAKPDAQDLIVLLGLWPQIRRGKRKLDVKQAQGFLESLGFEEFTAPALVEELGLIGEGSFGWTHPSGDEYGAQIALDIMTGKLAISTALRTADADRQRAQHEAHRFQHASNRR